MSEGTSYGPGGGKVEPGMVASGGNGDASSAAAGDPGARKPRLTRYGWEADLLQSPRWQERLDFEDNTTLRNDTGIAVVLGFEKQAKPPAELYRQGLARAVQAYGMVPTGKPGPIVVVPPGLTGPVGASEPRTEPAATGAADPDWLSVRGRRPWRVGNSVRRTIYDGEGELIGMLDTPELAALAVDSVNVLAVEAGNASPRAELSLQVEESRREIRWLTTQLETAGKVAADWRTKVEELRARRDELVETVGKLATEKLGLLGEVKAARDGFLRRVCELLGMCETPEGQGHTHYASEEEVLATIRELQRSHDRELERAVAELPESEGGCTSQSAVWCPVHGDCACPREPSGERSEESDECPLHGVTSGHAVPKEAAAAPVETG